MKETITRNEIAAWMQVGLGGIGTVGTVLASIPALRGVTDGGQLPSGFAGGIVMIQVFGLMLIFFVSMALVATGLGFLLGRLFEKTNAHAPYHAAFCLVAATLLGAAGATVAMVGNLLWIWCALQGVMAVVLAGLAQVREDNNRAVFWTIGIGGSVAILLFTVAVMANATNVSAIEPAVGVAGVKAVEQHQASGSS